MVELYDWPTPNGHKITLLLEEAGPDYRIKPVNIGAGDQFKPALLAGGGYTIADMAAYPWVVPWKRRQQNLDDFVNLRRWFDSIAARPGTQRTYAKGEPFAAQPAVNKAGKNLRFGQTAANVASG
jgi:glutathione S-transferase